MRIPNYMSPSSLKVFEKTREEFVLRYLLDERLPRAPQTQPMSIGSAFDAYVKSYLYHALFGNYGQGDMYKKEVIFESQVEPHNRDWAAKAGEYVFKRYCRCGALADMMFELNKASGQPRFEFDVQGFIQGTVGDIPLLGKPDIFFINDQGARVIWDWKVNGFCGKTATSPKKGYIKVVDTWGSNEARQSRNNGVAHKDCVIADHCGISINAATWMEDCDTEWADQLSIYAWLLGEPIGSEQVIVGIDQIVGNGTLTYAESDYPFIRVAKHRIRVSSDYQFTLADRLNYAWRCITSGYLFPELSREENDSKIKKLEAQGKALSDVNDPLAQFVNKVSRAL